MSSISLQTQSFRYLERSFKEWLDILGYAPSTIQQLPVCVREFLYYLENLPTGKRITQITAIDIPVIHQYYRALSQRTNKRKGGGLSNNYLNIHLYALNKLLEYLRKQGKLLLPPIGIPQETPNPKPVQPLTQNQIKSLYQATEIYEYQDQSLASRDRAMLAVFYDCGLRRYEGEQLNCSDVHLDNRLLHVRKAKGNQQRFVPFSNNTKNHLESYLLDARIQLQKEGKEEAFLLNKKGKRVSGNSLNFRLKYIAEQSEIDLNQTPIHLHILRHSIATHLLYQGMELEKVAQFLGHRSLESTQIYTHLMEKVYG